MDILLPPWVCVARARMNYVDSTGVSRSEFTGQVRTASKGGDRLSASLELGPTVTTTEQSARERAALISFLVRLRGRQNRAYMFDRSNRIRGSFPTGELLQNNTFEDGTTGWSATSAVLTVADRVLRVSASGEIASAVRATQTVTVEANVPYVLRGMFLNGNVSGNFALQAIDGALTPINASVPAGLASGAAVSSSTSWTVRFGDLADSQRDKFFLLPYASLSRCALVDTGPNLLLRSDVFSNAAWTKTRLTVSGADPAPDGTTTGERLIEDSTASNTHEVGQTVTISSAAADYSFAVALRAGNRSWAQIFLSELSGPSTVSAYVNLSTGAFGTTSVGANWSNLRTSSKNLGNGWFYFSIVARKTNTATSVSANIRMADSNGGAIYSGDGVSLIRAWRATLAQSSLPVRLSQTTSAATSGSNQTGSALYVKGLPVSTDGLLLENDQVEIITSQGSELKIVTAALNSDSSGIGYLQFEPPLRGVPAESAPVIIYKPMGRFMFAGDLIGWDNEPGIVTRASAEFEEA